MPDLKFLANMNISPLTVGDLRTSGWEVVRVPDVLDRRSTDVDILEYARQHNQVILTQDLDFSALLALSGHSKPSVVNLRLTHATPGMITKRLTDVLPVLTSDSEEGAIASVDEASARVRKLPIDVE